MGKPRSCLSRFFEITIIIACIVGLVVLIVLIVQGNQFKGKTLWDWLQLLIIPVVLALGGYLFTYTTGRTEREIAFDRQCEEALQAYIDKISELLLEKQLRHSTPEDEVRKIARVRTLTVLPRLDSRRKRSVLQFLHESGLIGNINAIVDMKGADLKNADLTFFHLMEASLVGADLSDANLYCARLDGTNLTEAGLIGANLRFTNLTNTILREAFLMGADLTYADLDGADLMGADLRGVEVTDEQLKQAKSLEGATLPDRS